MTGLDQPSRPRQTIPLARPGVFRLTDAMSDRLSDLQRQRALAQEQLAWLDREIEREKSASGQAAPTTSAAKPATPKAPVPPAAPLAPADADELIKKFQKDGRTVRGEVKRGCLIYFFAAFALLGLGVIALYFARAR